MLRLARTIYSMAGPAGPRLMDLTGGLYTASNQATVCWFERGSWQSTSGTAQ